MAQTICPHCQRSIPYAGATVCPFCGKACARSVSGMATSPQESSFRRVNALATAGVAVASSAGPAVPETASKGLRQLRSGLDRLLHALRGERNMLEFELALGEVAVALALLRTSDHWDVAEAGLEEALREFFAYKPGDDDRGRRIKGLQERLRKWFGDTIASGGASAPSPTRTLQRQAHGAAAMQASTSSLLSLVDTWTFEQFELERLRAEPLGAPTIYCESLEEFYGSFFAYRNMSAQEQARGVREESEQARAALASGGGAVLGVNWPGRGCFLNGEAFARMYKKRDAADALRSPDTFPHILSTAVHEKLGHGLLTEFTTRGKEIRSVHLEQHEVARHFLRRKSDDPRDALLQDKWNLLLTTSKFAEEGFSTWMESQVLGYALRKLQGGVRVDEGGVELQDVASTYPARTVVTTLREHDQPALATLADAIEFLAQAGPGDRRGVIGWMSGQFPHTDLAGREWERDQALEVVPRD